MNLAAAALFGALGLYLIVSSFQFPPGLGRLPGPGFFPGVLGAAMTLLAAMLLAAALRGPASEAPSIESRLRLLLTVALVAAYLALWGFVPFAPRTAAFAVAFLRLVGQPWRASLTVAAVLTAVVTAAFQYGLGVSLQ